MPETSQDVYQCPSCGALAAKVAGDDELRICTACGFEFGPAVSPTAPSVGDSEPASASGFVRRDVRSRRRAAEKVEAVVQLEAATTTTDVAVVRGRSEDEVVSDDGRKKVVRRRKKRKRTKGSPLLFLAAWTVVVLVVVIFVRRHWAEEEAEVEDPRELEEMKLEVKRQKMREFLSKHFDECHATLEEFLTAESTAARTQFVWNSEGLASTMKNHYLRELPWTLPKDGRLVVRNTNLFMHKDRTTIEAVYGVEGGESAQRDREVAFVSEDGNWVIDWEGLVRFSSHSWQLFLERVGGVSEGVFRVYMRNTRGTPENEPGFILKFYPPSSDHLDDKKMWQQGSPLVTVPLESENGRRIQWILERAKRKRELGDSGFGVNDPDKLHRVRVALAWVGEDDERVLELRAVQANNWYGSGFEEDFGAEEPAPPGAEPAVPAPKEEGEPGKDGRPAEDESPSDGLPVEPGAGRGGPNGAANLSIASK